MRMSMRLSGKTLNMAVLAAVCLLIATWLAVSPTPLDEEAVTRSVSDYGWVKSDQVVVTATGNEGAAVGSGSTGRDLHGHIYALHLDFATGVTSTTDITLTQASPSLTVLLLTNNYTDTWYYPAVEQTDSAGSGLSVYDRLLVDDAIDISVGEATSSTTMLTVTVYWGE